MAILCFEGYNDKIIKYVNKYNIIDSEFDRYIEESSEVIGINLSDFLADNISNVSTVDAIIAKIIIVYVTDLCIYKKYMESGIKADVFIGYSLGFITAAVCSNAITFRDGLVTLKCIGDCIRYADTIMDCSLLIEMGLDEETVNRIIRKNGVENKIKIVGVCSEYCMLISGDSKCMEQCIMDMKQEGVLGTNKLEIRMPYHYMEYSGWIDKFCTPITMLDAKDPEICCYSITKRKKLCTAEEMIDGLNYDFVRKLYWKDAIEALEDEGHREFWDISLNGGIKKMTEFSNPESEMYNYKFFRNKEI